MAGGNGDCHPIQFKLPVHAGSCCTLETLHNLLASLLGSLESIMHSQQVLMEAMLMQSCI